jgi:hypothetical protein
MQFFGCRVYALNTCDEHPVQVQTSDATWHVRIASLDH